MSSAHHPSISAVIPTYNRAHIIGRAIRSALAELGKEDEVIVLDDGSTDNTEEKVRSFADPRIRYIRQENGGAGRARNRGAREATRELVAYLDSDDEWLPGKIPLQRRLMAARPDVLFNFTDFIREFNGQRHPRAMTTWHSDKRPWSEILGPALLYSSVAELPPGIPDFPLHFGDLYRNEMRHNYILTSCIMIRREAAGDAIHFTEGAKTFEDWECFGHLAAKGKACYAGYETTIQHGHPGPRLTDADQLTCAEARLVVLRNVWGSDEAFLARHGDEYNHIFRQQILLRVRGLLVHGRCEEAREQIRQLEAVPSSYRMLAQLPGPVVSSLLEIRRTANALLGRD